MIKLQNPANGRYYHITHKKDLFGDDILVVVRGGRSRNLVRHVYYRTTADLHRAVDRLEKTRTRNGYLRVV